MNEETSHKFLRRVAKTGYLLQTAPFVRAILLNGSLAQGTAKKSSDIDLLIIAKPGRIFTARFFVNGLLTIFKVKRSSDDSFPHDRKICPNYFLTEDFLKIATKRGVALDQYCADCYSNCVLVSGSAKIFERFLVANSTLFKRSCALVPPLFKKFLAHRFPLKESRFFGGCQKITECFFAGKIGDFIELKLKNWQIKRIERDPRTKQFPDLISYSDKELRFHPPKHN